MIRKWYQNGTWDQKDLAQYFLITILPHSTHGRQKNTLLASSPQSNTTKIFLLLPSILSPPHIIPTHCNVPQLHEKLPHPTDFPPLHLPSAANCDSLSTHTGPLALVDIMRTIYTETMPSAANQVAKNDHITSLVWILPELYLLLLQSQLPLS